ncbi:MAG: 50S ribosomal protein L21 [Candidatus Dormibacteraeota bacterium]|nr:50S ribosomal protein L21 [Candidatus Dormibacteraeota bacterium]
MPNSSGPLTAVVVSGGKQYRVASGDRILVDRVAAEPGSQLRLERVLMLVEGDSVKLGPEAIGDRIVTARVLGHRRGPKIDVLRYKSKKRVRVHRGARADLTALEIVSVGPPVEVEPRKPEKPARERRQKATAEPGPDEASAEGEASAADGPAAEQPRAEQVGEPQTDETKTEARDKE